MWFKAVKNEQKPKDPPTFEELAERMNKILSGEDVPERAEYSTEAGKKETAKKHGGK